MKRPGPILVTVATVWTTYHTAGPTARASDHDATAHEANETTDVDLMEVPLWDVMKTELYERYVEGLLWRPALWLDNRFNGRSGRRSTPWDVRLELHSYKLRHQNKRARILGRMPWTSSVEDAPIPGRPPR